MPLVPFENLPENARVWVFAAQGKIDAAAAKRLLVDVDEFLAHWQAHGTPLTVGRSFRDERFLTVAVDQSTAGASGCSIDGMFRTLRALEPTIGTSLLGGGRICYRDATGDIQSVTHAEFASLAASGQVGPETIVFDTTVETLSGWRERFETTAGHSWHARLLPAASRPN
jgi:hypothetical protein